MTPEARGVSEAMSNSGAYAEAEDWVREKGLRRHFPGTLFRKDKLTVGQRADGDDGLHEFDAISENNRIVVSVKASTGLTKRGKYPSAKVSNANAELLFLSLLKGKRRILVLTDPEFFEIFSRVSDGRRPKEVELLHVPLPALLQSRVHAARETAAAEVSRTHSPPK
jgi:hypothetical protein